jgi:excinuclease ABC subunit C
MSRHQRNQQRLFDLPNPLPERLGAVFFDELPTSPGVYKMFDRQEKLLYVGKAKNLRRRLFAYKSVRKETASRKTVKLVRMIHNIRYEQAASEEAALLRENELLREHRPPFNHLNTQPETYYYITVERLADSWNFQLRMHEPNQTGDNLRGYGAFKGHGQVRRSLGALLRLLWIRIEEIDSTFLFPSVLIRRLTPLNYKLRVNLLDPKERSLLWRRVNQLLNGTARSLLDHLMAMAEERDLLGEQIGVLLLEDLDQLHYFYKRCTTTNYRIYKAFDLDSPMIPQDQLDDWLVRYSFWVDREE